MPRSEARPGGSPLLRVAGLKVHFAVPWGPFSRAIREVRAVDGVSLEVRAGETLGLVGESGSGKTTVARCILRLLRPTAGRIWFDGKDILALNKAQLLGIRKQIQIVFQDPYASLNPRMTVGSIVGEALDIHRIGRRAERHERVRCLLETVGLDPRMVSRYPHEFSGGERQRIGIARALAVQPRLIVADEPVSALDVSVQAQVINLLADLQDRLRLGYLFIAHDLAVVRQISDRVAVMYRGRIVEEASRDALYQQPLHPYTRTLLVSVPVPDPSTRSGIRVEGLRPPGGASQGCVYSARCPRAEDRCSAERPSLTDVGEAHFVACHLV